MQALFFKVDCSLIFYYLSSRRTSTGANLPEMAMHEGVDSQQESTYSFDLYSITELRSKQPSSLPSVDDANPHFEELPVSEGEMSDSEPLQTGDAQTGRSLRINTNQLRRAYSVAAPLRLSIASNAPLDSGILSEHDRSASAEAESGAAAAAVYPSFSRDCIPNTLMHHYRAPRAAPLVHLERVRFNLYDAPSNVPLLRPRPDVSVAARAAVPSVPQPESVEDDRGDAVPPPPMQPQVSVWKSDLVSIQPAPAVPLPPKAIDLSEDAEQTEEPDSAPTSQAGDAHGAINLEELLRRVGAEAYAPLLRSQEIGATDLIFLSEDDWALLFPDCALGVRRLLQALLLQEHMRVPASGVYHRHLY